MKSRRVVVTGLGAICPIGNDVQTIWNNAANGKSGAGPITYFDTTLFKTKFACEVKDFDSKANMGRDARKFDSDTHYGIDSAIQAINDSKLDFEKEDCNRIGVVFGEGIGGIRSLEEELGTYFRNFEKGPRFSPDRKSVV